jgi:hypothetical protein
MPGIPTLLAYCGGADGRIQFTTGDLPEGMLPIGRCTALSARTRERWRRTVEGLARLGYDDASDRNFFVPGIPEAGRDQLGALDALHKFCERVANVHEKRLHKAIEKREAHLRRRKT